MRIGAAPEQLIPKHLLKSAANDDATSHDDTARARCCAAASDARHERYDMNDINFMDDLNNVNGTDDMNTK